MEFSAMNAAPALSIVVPCFNRAHGLPRILRAYERQQQAPPFELIAVDDGSRDETPQVLQQFDPHSFRLRYVRLPINRGPAMARNLGLSLASARLVAFVGDDICPSTDFVAGHVRAHEHAARDEIAVLGHTIWPVDLPRNTLMAHIDGVGAQQFSYHYMHDGQFYDYRHLYTSNVSLKRSFIESSGEHFDTGFTYAAFEDAELGWRLERHGLRILYHADILASHYHYSTIWTFSERQFRCGQMSWLFIRKHPTVLPRLTDRAQMRFVLLSVRQPPHGAGPSAEELEARSLAAAAAHEWRFVRGLDRYYFRLLQYFYYRGLLSAVFATRPDLTRIRDRHAALVLAPALAEFEM